MGGYRDEMRRYVKDGWCPACGTFFHTRLRALAHLQRCNRKCREKELAGECPEITEEERVEADAAEQAWRVHVRETGVSLLAGPPCVRPDPPQSHTHSLPHQAALMHCLTLFLYSFAVRHADSQV